MPPPPLEAEMAAAGVETEVGLGEEGGGGCCAMVVVVVVSGKRGMQLQFPE
jgi:hypothetical protein